jgi:hypothetical protein
MAWLHGTTWAKDPDEARRFTMRVGVVAVLAMMAAIGGLLAARRVSGNAARDLPLMLLAPTAAMAAAMVFGARLAWREAANPPSSPAGALWPHLAGTIALALFAVGCSYPGQRLADWIVWLPPIGLDAWAGYALLQRQRAQRGISLRQLPPAVPTHNLNTNGLTQPAAVLVTENLDGDEGLVLLQELRRLRSGDGIETIAATLRAEFVTGQRHTILHVGFCPPLSHLPRVEVEAADGPEAEVRVVQAFAHGVRLEVRLARPAEKDCWVLVELTATPQSPGLADDKGPLETAN